MRYAILLALLLFLPVRGGAWQVVGGDAPVSTYLLAEDFDGSSACGDGSHTNCSGSWTGIGTPAPADFNYAASPAPLVGTGYSLLLSGTQDTPYGWYRGFTAHDTVYFYFVFHATNRSAGTIFALRDSSGNTVMRVVDSGPEMSIYCNDVIDYQPVTNFVVNTTYHTWGRYTKGTGSNAVCELYHSTTSTKPESPNLSATGNATAQAAQIFITKPGNDQSHIYDKIRVSTSSIGGDPL